MMDNPYIFRGPVHVPQMFFGRTHELDEIAAFLRGNQSVHRQGVPLAAGAVGIVGGKVQVIEPGDRGGAGVGWYAKLF